MNTSTKNLLIVGLTLGSIVFVFGYLLPNVFGYERDITQFQKECGFPDNMTPEDYILSLPDVSTTEYQKFQHQCYLDVLFKQAIS